jgi:hypothetical protein
MTMMLLDATPQAGPFLELWVAVAFLAGVAANLVTLFRVNQKQKREVSFSFEPASKMEFERHVESNRQEHAQLFAKLGGVERGWNERLMGVHKELLERIDARFAEMQREDRESRRVLHERINEVLAAVSRIQGKMER